MRKLCIPVALMLLLVPLAAFGSATDGTIDPQHRYAWSTDFGWINFAASQGNIHVTDTGLSGYAWGQNIGWINLAPTNSGQQVTNDGAGHLGGSAWAEGVGWLSFSGIIIDASGVFHGVNTTGSLTFNCDQCDVRTDWRPVSMRTGGTPPVTSGGGASSTGSPLPHQTTPPASASPTPSGSGVPVAYAPTNVTLSMSSPSPAPGTSGPAARGGWFARLWAFFRSIIARLRFLWYK